MRPPTPPLPAFTISLGPLWMKSKSEDTALATTLPVTTELPFSSYATNAFWPGECVLDIRGCRAVVRPPPSPLPAFDISIGPLWIKSKSGDATHASTLPTPKDPHPRSPACRGRPRECMLDI